VPKISEAAKEERRERILAGARRCFARHGYEGATVVRLEQEIGFSRGAIFNWFGSKEELFLALATRDRDRISSIWTDRGLEAALRATVAEDPDWLRVYFDVVHRLRTDPSFRERWEARAPKEQESRIVSRMRDEQAAGRLRADLDPQQIGHVLGVVFDGLAAQRAAGYDPPLDALLTVLRDALRPVKGRRRGRTSA
jgi:AcrR family transcriptional regulator